MRRRLVIVAGAAALVFALSSCWALKSFSILDYTLNPGQTTKARFTLRPMSEGLKVSGRQFVIVGVGAIGLVADNTDIGLQAATWGTNGKFGGPLPMGVTNAIVTSLAPGDCSASGLDFTDIGGVLWKAYATPVNKNDGGKVELASVVDVVIKAKAAEVDPDQNYTIMGVAGMWQDDGDGVPETTAGSDDAYVCWGISTAGVHILA